MRNIWITGFLIGGLFQMGEMGSIKVIVDVPGHSILQGDLLLIRRPAPGETGVTVGGNVPTVLNSEGTEHRVGPARVKDGVADRVLVTGPGTYIIFLSNVTLARIHDQQKIVLPHLPVLPLPDHELTLDDLRQKFTTIRTKPIGVLHVDVVDLQSHPVANADLTISGSDIFGVTVKTDHAGRYTFWGLPESRYFVRSRGSNELPIEVGVVAGEEGGVIVRNR